MGVDREADVKLLLFVCAAEQAQHRSGRDAHKSVEHDLFFLPQMADFQRLALFSLASLAQARTVSNVT